MTKTITLDMQKDVGSSITVKLEKKSALITMLMRSTTGNDTSLYK